MDKQYKDINIIVDEILSVFYIVIPMFIIGSTAFIFKDEIVNGLITFSSDIAHYSF